MRKQIGMATVLRQLYLGQFYFHQTWEYCQKLHFKVCVYIVVYMSVCVPMCVFVCESVSIQAS